MNYFVRNLILGSAVAVLAFGAVAVCSGLVNADTKIPLDKAHFPDKAFRECVKEYFDDDGDGYLSSAEIEDNFVLNCNRSGVKDLTGIEYLTNLRDLDVEETDLTEMDLSKNTKLEELYCRENKLTKLDVSKNTKLIKLFCGENNLTKLDVSNNTKLILLCCEKNKLTKLDVSKNTELGELGCEHNSIEALDVSKNTKLVKLDCTQNPIEALDVSNNLELYQLDCGDTKITKLDISKNTKLIGLSVQNLGLTELALSISKDYWYLDVSGNKLKSLDVSGYKSLEHLYCNNSELETLNLSGCKKLSTLICNDNKLETLDVSDCSKLYELCCQGNRIKTLDLGNCEYLKSAFVDKEEEKDGYTIYTYGVISKFCVDKDTVLTFDTLEIDDNVKTLDLKCGSIGSPKIKGSDAQVQLMSSDTSVARVIRGNNIHMLKAGYSTITVKGGGKEYKIKVRSLYKDVSDSSKFWFEPTYALTDKGVVKGYDNQTKFKPANKCTRAQMVTFIWRLAGSPEPKTKECKFSDVKKNDYFYKACIWGNENHIVEGYKDGTFGPQTVCARRHAVTFLWRLAGKPEPNIDKIKFTDVFKDIDEEDYFYKACLWASEKKIVAGYSDNTFRPNDDCLRRQMVTFLYKFDKYVGVKK